MRSSEERLLLLHLRAKEYAGKRTKSILSVQWSVCSLLLFALVVMIGRFSGGGVGYTENIYTASSLLSESAGGYVMVAVAAFMLGVIVTVTIKSYRHRKETQQEGDDK